MTAPPRCLLESHVELFEEITATLRPLILADVLLGRSEDAIYGEHISKAIRAARHLGRDESDVEVAASLARTVVASILAELREAGLTAEDD